MRMLLIRLGRVAMLFALVALCHAPAPAALAGESRLFAGPVRAKVLEVLDGDTFLAEALVWPGHTVRVNVRIRGIDAPEMKGRCESERAAALQARDGLAGLIGKRAVSISNIGGAKYYGRVLADVTAEDGTALASRLIERALARPYGGGKRLGWCG